MIETFPYSDLYLLNVGILIFSYLLGSISFAILISKLRGLKDPRGYGSNNPGATNVLRSGDKVAAFLTLFGDAMKGFLVVFVIRNLYVSDEPNFEEIILISGASISVFLGHLFPIFFRFRGGKGVATGGGILFGVDGFLGLTVFCTWIFAFSLSKISAYAALFASFSSLLFATIFIPLTWHSNYEILILSIWLISLLLFLRHIGNIQDMLKL
tara:strand:- start:669 stop:1304 length:636 start_codon:yes stop_codon:yes gene_type:complete